MFRSAHTVEILFVVLLFCCLIRAAHAQTDNGASQPSSQSHSKSHMPAGAETHVVRWNDVAARGQEQATDFWVNTVRENDPFKEARC